MGRYDRSYENLARVYSKKIGVDIRFTGSGFCTDGKKIYMPDLPDELNAEYKDPLLSGLVHECLHIEHSKFDKEPPEIRKKFPGLTNNIEDIRILNLGRKQYPGMDNLQHNGIKFLKPTIIQDIVNEYYSKPPKKRNVPLLLGACLQFRASNENEEMFPKEIRELADKVEPIVKEKHWTPGERGYNESYEVTKKIIEKIKELKEEQQDEKQEENPNQENQKGKEGQPQEQDEEEKSQEENKGKQKQENEVSEEEEEDKKGKGNQDEEEQEDEEDYVEGEGGEKQENEVSEEEEEDKKGKGNQDEEEQEDEEDYVEGEGGEEQEDEVSEEEEEDKKGKGNQDEEEQEDEEDYVEGEGGEEQEDEKEKEAESNNGQNEETKKEENNEKPKTLEENFLEGEPSDNDVLPEGDLNQAFKDILEEIISQFKKETNKHQPHPLLQGYDAEMHIKDIKDSPVLTKTFRSLTYDLDFKKAFKKAMVGADKQTHLLRSKMLPLLMSEKRSSFLFEQTEGDLDQARLFRIKNGDQKIYKKKVPGRKINTAISILCDISGSMGGGHTPYSEVSILKASLRVLSDSLFALRIPFEILAFSTLTWSNYKTIDGKTNPYYSEEFYQRTRNVRLFEEDKRIYNRFLPLFHLIVKEFNENYITAKDNIINLTGLGDNVDCESVAWALERLAQRKEQRRILFVLSDGQPASYFTDSDIVIKDIKERINQAKQAGIEVIGVGICSDYVKRIYGDVEIINKQSEMGEKLYKALFKQFLNRGR